MSLITSLLGLHVQVLLRFWKQVGEYICKEERLSVYEKVYFQSFADNPKHTSSQYSDHCFFELEMRSTCKTLELESEALTLEFCL